MEMPLFGKVITEACLSVRDFYKPNLIILILKLLILMFKISWLSLRIVTMNTQVDSG